MVTMNMNVNKIEFGRQATHTHRDTHKDTHKKNTHTHTNKHANTHRQTHSEKKIVLRPNLQKKNNNKKQKYSTDVNQITKQCAQDK